MTDTIKTSVDETANPSDISGRSVSIGAGGNLNIVGSLVMADGAVGLHADQDLNLLATSESSYAYESRSVSKSGIFGNGGLSITIGSKNSTNITSSQETRQASTSVGSLAGDVLGTAGGQYLQLSSDITAPQGDVNIAAQNITLQSNNNTRSVLNIVRERQSGITLAASNPLVNTAQTASEMAKVAKRTENGRYQAMALLTSGLTIYNQYRTLTNASKDLTQSTADAATNQWTFSLGLGASQTNFESLTTSTTPIESSINAGRNVSLIATGGGADRGDINLIGSRVVASENLTLKAERDITLTAAVGRDTEQTKRTSSASSVGISFGQGGPQTGYTINLAASRSNAWSNGWGTTFWNSELTAGKLLSVDSGRDWSLSGAKATGETVLARVGSKGAGNLTIVSPQDESFYQAKEQSFGINVSIPVPAGGGFGIPTLGVNAGGLKLLAENESIKQQSSIVAGTGGYDLRVNGHTHLKGSAIASKAVPGLNYFETQTLTHEDVVNRDVMSGQSWSVGVNISAGSATAGALAGSSVGYARMDTGETFTTKSSIASTVNLTRPDLQAGKVAAMKAAERDPLVAARNQKETQLALLLSQEPPRCDSCQFNGTTPPPDAPAGTTLLARGDASANQSGTPSSLAQTEQGPPTINLADGSDSQWQAWQAAVQALQNDINRLNTRISAVDAKVYQASNTLSNNPSGLHMPMLHTFDKNKATQELRDGVAVTAAFGKAAFKAVGDLAKDKAKDAQTACGGPTVANCPEAAKWADGGIYKVLLHGVVGAVAGGGAGAVAGATAESLTPDLRKALIAAGVAEGSVLYELLMPAAKMMVTGGLTGTAGAAVAFNADANNRQLHHWQYRLMKAGCGGRNTSSLDCARLLGMEGVRSDALTSLPGVPGVQIERHYDAAGNLVGATLFDGTSGQPSVIMDKVDYDKIMALSPDRRSGALVTNMATLPLGGMACSELTLICEAKGGISRSELDRLFRMGQGRYTVMYRGDDINLKDFVFKTPWPDVGTEQDMVVDWAAMQSKYSGLRLWADDSLDVTKFGSIRVRRIDATTVQILPDDYDFDLKLDPGNRRRDVITAAQGLRAGGFSIGDRQIGSGAAFTIVVVGTSKIGP